MCLLRSGVYGLDSPNRDIASAVARPSVPECYPAVGDTFASFDLIELVLQEPTDLDRSRMNRIGRIAVAINNVIQFIIAVIVEPVYNVMPVVVSFARLRDAHFRYGAVNRLWG